MKIYRIVRADTERSYSLRRNNVGRSRKFLHGIMDSRIFPNMFPEEFQSIE